MKGHIYSNKYDHISNIYKIYAPHLNNNNNKSKNDRYIKNADQYKDNNNYKHKKQHGGNYIQSNKIISNRKLSPLKRDNLNIIKNI